MDLRRFDVTRVTYHPIVPITKDIFGGCQTVAHQEKFPSTRRSMAEKDIWMEPTPDIIAIMKPAFTKANSYIFDKSAWSWSLPSGYSCPGALTCLAKADQHTGKLTHGEDQEFTCYSAIYERFPSIRKRYWCNFEAVKGKSIDEVVNVLSCLPNSARLVRIHTAGDFFSQDYFDGWIKFIQSKPNTKFYAFTKSLPLWVRRLGEIPPNLELQASYGGKWDNLIAENNLKYAKVVYSQSEADQANLVIDTDDRLAAEAGGSFALLAKPRTYRKEVHAPLFQLTIDGK